MDNKNQHFYLPTLDGWRAISIILVIVYHSAWYYVGPDSLDFNPYRWHFFKLGGYGVSLFFIISGFLITNRIIYEIQETSQFNLKNFYIRRGFRILPPLYFYLLMMTLLSFTHSLNFSLKDLLSSLLFFRIYVSDGVGWSTAHIWSLCVEELFYIFLSLLFYFFSSKKLLRISLFF